MNNNLFQNSASENKEKDDQILTDNIDYNECTLQEKYDSLQKNFDSLQKNFDSLQKNFDSLQEKYDNLFNDYNILSENYSENVIIQSMNDMKIKYDNVIKSSVSLYKYQILQEKFTHLIRGFSGCSVLIDHTIKVLKESKNSTFVDKKNLISKAELELITIKEILEDSIILNTE